MKDCIYCEITSVVDGETFVSECFVPLKNLKTFIKANVNNLLIFKNYVG